MTNSASKPCISNETIVVNEMPTAAPRSLEATVAPSALQTEIDAPASRECVICYESLSSTKNMCVTECGHEFCFGCIMKHVQRNNGCPICRTALVEELEDSDSEDDSEGEYDEDDDETIEETVDYESDTEYPIEQLVASFEAKGYGLQDALSLLMYKFSKTDPKYTKAYIKQLEEDIEDMNGELQGECEEREDMAEEDERSSTHGRGEVCALSAQTEL